MTCAFNILEFLFDEIGAILEVVKKNIERYELKDYEHRWEKLVNSFEYLRKKYYSFKDELGKLITVANCCYKVGFEVKNNKLSKLWINFFEVPFEILKEINEHVYVFANHGFRFYLVEYYKGMTWVRACVDNGKVIAFDPEHIPSVIYDIFVEKLKNKNISTNEFERLWNTFAEAYTELEAFRDKCMRFFKEISIELQKIRLREPLYKYIEVLCKSIQESRDDLLKRLTLFNKCSLKVHDHIIKMFYYNKYLRVFIDGEEHVIFNVRCDEISECIDKLLASIGSIVSN